MKEGSASLISALLCAAAAGAGYKQFVNSDSGWINAAPWLLLAAASGLLTFSILKLERSRSFGDQFGFHAVMDVALIAVFGVARTLTIPWSYSYRETRIERFHIVIQGIGIFLALFIASAVVAAITARLSRSSTQ
jgi:hypothetical protein